MRWMRRTDDLEVISEREQESRRASGRIAGCAGCR